MASKDSSAERNTAKVSSPEMDRLELREQQLADWSTQLVVFTRIVPVSLSETTFQAQD